MSPQPSRSRPLRVLILGGSSEARALGAALAGRADIAASLSLAGRVREPAPQPLPTRIGGFGGVDGLVAYLRTERIALLIDATHPFAAIMSTHAMEAARQTGTRLIVCGRPAWRAQAGDQWTEVDTMAEAAAALGDAPLRVFLTIGRQQLTVFAAAPHHRYLVRSIEPVDTDHGLPDATFVTARGPFPLAAEAELMRVHGIEVLVTKNSGGAASHAKLAAARELGLPVVLVRRPRGHMTLSVVETLAAMEEIV